MPSCEHPLLPGRKACTWIVAVIALLCSAWPARTEVFVLPTSNRAIFTPGAEDQYFVPTPGRDWTSGTFGCVRTDGFQLHEGLDIKCLKRDQHGEPADPVFATAAGTVAYINEKVGLSNYGRYIVLRHEIEGIPVFTVYAHLSAIAPGLQIGHPVQQSQVIATMGRSSNTRSGISKERAHVHFEIDLQATDRFAEWHKAKLTGQRNDHGNWNGRNLIGLDPRLILLEQEKLGPQFSLLNFIRNQTELCRVMVRDTKFPWLKAYTPLIRRNPVAEKNGVTGYELVLNFNGLPFQLIPRAAEEIHGRDHVHLVSVNAEEQAAHHCRKLVTQRSGQWELAHNGLELLDMLTY
jgi:murein DD-endopeptidase MepM/ murein hydrolase activator NlpD